MNHNQFDTLDKMIISVFETGQNPDDYAFLVSSSIKTKIIDEAESYGAATYKGKKINYRKMTSLKYRNHEVHENEFMEKDTALLMKKEQIEEYKNKYIYPLNF